MPGEWKDDLINKMSATAVTIIVIIAVVGYFAQPVILRWIDSKTEIEIQLINREKKRTELIEQLDSLKVKQDETVDKLFVSKSDKDYYKQQVYPRQQLIMDSINVLSELIKQDSIKIIRQQKMKAKE